MWNYEENILFAKGAPGENLSFWFLKLKHKKIIFLLKEKSFVNWS